MDTLTTERLTIRSFESGDLKEAHRILNEAFRSYDAPEDFGSWLEWSALSARWFPAMHQFPYGDRAITLAATGELVGAAGYVPVVIPSDQIPELARRPGPGASGRMMPEVGLFWAIDPRRQRQGYGTEVANALIDYGFRQLRLWRIVGTTRYDNHASQTVMLKAGMTLTRNPLPEPEWLQVVGVRYAEPSPAHPSHEPPGLTT